MAHNRHLFFNQQLTSFTNKTLLQPDNPGIKLNKKVPFLDPDIIPSGGFAIGHGKFSVVYLGKWNNQTVAIKKIHERSTSDWIKQCENEKDILQTLKMHNVPNVIDFYAYSHQKSLDPYSSVYYLITEYMSGGSLQDMFESQISYDWVAGHKIARDITIAVISLHALEIVHVDIKPANILLDDTGNAKLCDFGFAKKIDENEWNAFSPLWAAPEVFDCYIHNKKTDIFSLTIVLWQLVAQKQQPYIQIKINSLHELQSFVKNGGRETIPAHCPKNIASLITWGWDNDPKKRPSAEEFLQALDSQKVSLHMN